MVLGVPTGTGHYRRAQVYIILTDMAPPTAVLSLISPLTAVHLLLQCYNLRPAYLQRTAANLTDTAVSPSFFDDSICGAVAAVPQNHPVRRLQDPLLSTTQVGRPRSLQTPRNSDGEKSNTVSPGLP